MSEWKAKRFWKDVSIEPEGPGHRILLDARALKTPAKQSLVVPTDAMARAIAAEWDAQEDVIDPGKMPFTRTANAAIDKVSVQHSEVADMLAAYGDSDLLCYRAERPDRLVARQAEQWDPMLDWAADALNVRLKARSGVMHVAQDPAALAILSGRVQALSAFQLAAFHDLVSLSGSLILGFAAALDAKSSEEIWDISRLDEIWQAEEWGQDEEAEADAGVKRAAFMHAKQVFTLC